MRTKLIEKLLRKYGLSHICQGEIYYVEQIAEADLLTDMLSADILFVVKYKGFRFGKKACQLAQAA